MGSLQKSDQDEKLMLQKRPNSSLANLPDVKLCEIVYGVNQLRQYPLNDIEIAEWSETLLEFKPDLDYKALEFIIQQMKFGNMEYEQRDGVQNLTRAFQKIEKTEDGFRIRKLNVW